MEPTGARVLIVDDEKDFCDILFRVVKKAGFTALVAHDGEMALEMVRQGLPDIVLLDVRMPGMDGIEVLKRAKPLDNNALLQKIRTAISERRVLSKKTEPNGKSGLTLGELKRLMGPSANVDRLISDLNLVAGSNFSVVIQGETGSGKELVAQAIHHFSSRSKKLMVPVDCGAIPETLFESEVFG